MKRLYEFYLSQDSMVDEVSTTKDDQGNEVTMTTKVKKPLQKKFFLRQPTRSLQDRAELYHEKIFNLSLQAGILSQDMLMKRIENDGGLLSDINVKAREEMFTKFTQIRDSLQKQLLKPEAERSVEEKAEIEKTNEEFGSALKAIREFDARHSAIFEHTAEARARNKLLVWWFLFLSYAENDEGEPIEIFKGKNEDEKYEAYDQMIERSDKFDLELSSKLLYLISVWFVNRPANQEQFDEILKQLENA